LVAPNPGPMTLEGTNAYLVGDGPCVVIDPGPADPGHLEEIRAAAAKRGGLGAILLTHGHGDHVEGAASLEAEVVELGDGESHGGLTALATPGHAPDHLCFLLGDPSRPPGAVCFSGDLVLGQGSSFVPPDGGSLAAYMESLRRLQGTELELICPGHGPWVTDPAVKLAEYLEHRLDRERRLLAALERGERSKEKLLAEAWSDVPDELLPAAAVVMEAHLQKLDAEGRLPPGLGD
jgi:glyoxylase-like metal-dependent hydrolase (beta-lactamase superfamily II)